MHVIVIALPCWYVDCIDPVFSAIFCHKILISFGFSHCTSILTMMNCAEKQTCMFPREEQWSIHRYKEQIIHNEIKRLPEKNPVAILTFNCFI